MIEQTLAEALALTSDGDGGLEARLTPGFSNAALGMDPLRGAPFGGLMAALAAGAARQGLGIEPPLLSLSVQYLAAARFEPVRFQSSLGRGGRSTAFASVRAGQDDRTAVQALATFGRTGAGPRISPLRQPATPPGELDPLEMDPRFAPWFTRHIDHRFDHSVTFGGASESEPQMRLWMRTRDGEPLDEARLCFLLDGIFPSYMTVLPPPPVISASVDLRYDLLQPITPDTSPDGWALFRFQVQDVGGGWAVDDGVAFAPDGRALALVRQRRKLVLRAASA